jgi:putative membrane protein
MMGRLKATAFFTDAEKEQIKEVTIAAEAGTIGEIAVIVVDESSEYHEAEILGGTILGSLVALIVTILLFHESIWWYVPLSFILFFPAWFLFKEFRILKIYCIGNKRKEKAVRERALKAFYEKGLYKTKQNTGVLFFVSLLEHKVWVLADKGIHEKIKQGTLNKFARHVAEGIRESHACDNLIKAIREAGELLTQHYPIQPGDINELSDEIICEDSTKCD